MTVEIGIQLYSVRRALAADPEGTLGALVDLGFTRFEGANHQAMTEDGIGFGISPELLNRIREERGVSIVGCHVNPLDLDRLPRVLDFQQRIGNPRIGCDIEFYPYGDVDHVRRRADVFTEVGRLCAERGMEFYYHNHFQEFQRFGDDTVYELLMAHTDPALVRFELDTYWACRGGADPLQLFERWPERFALIHQKDFPKDHPAPLNLFEGTVAPDASIDMALFERIVQPRDFAEVGTGVLPVQAIVDAVDRLPDFRYVLLEQDHAPGPELDSVRISRDALRRLDHVAW